MIKLHYCKYMIQGAVKVLRMNISLFLNKVTTSERSRGVYDSVLYKSTFTYFYSLTFVTA